ncbi:cupin domain-containing protein [Dyadobacter tibetensis]|uniref:cupin domain-containing protein n=1 Tax=Dyadobacter tibetensis TaxID=1211851 RepID=UPI00046F8DFB|nr:cupin domain-containing protein [Dyadobacter tibetensis]
MNEIQKFLEGGLLELYVLGEASSEEMERVEQMALEFPEIRAELHAIEKGLENYALTQSKTVDPKVKPFLMATIDFMDRMENGEIMSTPPLLNPESEQADYETWLNRPDLDLPAPDTGIQAKIICANPGFLMAIVWIREGSPVETHTNELESFLILEGSCNIIIAGKDHHLHKGDFLTIPLHQPHEVVITSAMACKLILQRVAA